MDKNFIDIVSLIKKISNLFGRDQIVVNNVVFVIQYLLSVRIYDDFKAFGNFGVHSTSLDKDFHFVTYGYHRNNETFIPSQIEELWPKLERLSLQDLRIISLFIIKHELLGEQEIEKAKSLIHTIKYLN